MKVFSKLFNGNKDEKGTAIQQKANEELSRLYRNEETRGIELEMCKKENQDLKINNHNLQNTVNQLCSVIKQLKTEIQQLEDIVKIKDKNIQKCTKEKSELKLKNSKLHESVMTKQRSSTELVEKYLDLHELFDEQKKIIKNITLDYKLKDTSYPTQNVDYVVSATFEIIDNIKDELSTAGNSEDTMHQC